MLTLLAALTLSQAAPPAAAQTPDECRQEGGCIRTGPAQLFALADKLYQSGDLEGAANILQALTQDVHPELRAEARFRLAAVREKLGDLKGAAQTLRELLIEQPDANRARLELARILSEIGDKKAAQKELAKAQAVGLPPEVEQNVRRFSSSLNTTKQRGFSLELTGGPDSNVNRSTSSQYVDTIIAPFELDPDARGQSGVGFAFGGQAFSHNQLFGTDLLSRVGTHADLFSKPRFNDIQLTVDTGPEWNGELGQIRPALLHERRWYGGHPYSTGFGASIDWVVPVSGGTQLEFTGSRVRQHIKPNRGQDGWRSNLALDLSRALGKTSGARMSLRYAALDARQRPESLRQYGAGLFLAHGIGSATLFGEIDYTRTDGLEPIFLFGKTRHDRRTDITAGIFLNKIRVAGFSPLVRLTHSDSSANIAIYEYKRTRLDFGFSRSF